MAGTLSRNATRALARALSSVFFREVTVEGAERIPADGPLIYAVNHPNSLVDPLIIHGMLPRNPRFLAKHGLWDIAAVRPFLKLAGSIPVYRSQDTDAKTVQNLETFDACHRELAAGAVIGIFPEGMTHSEPSLMPVKTGVARIVLGAEEKYGPLGIRIVPVGLTFEAGHLFRSRALLTVGEPVGPFENVPRDKGEFRRARNALTAEVEKALRGVTLNYRSRMEARLLERAVDLFAKTPSELPDRPGLPALFELRKRFAGGYEMMQALFPERVAEVAARVDTYDRMLRFTGFTDEQVVSSYPAGRVLGYLARTVGRLLLYLPLAASGILLNWIPYRLTALIAKPRAAKPHDPATFKILGGLFVYPTAWAFQCVPAGLLFGWSTALTLLLLSPLTGYVAMRFVEDGGGFWAESFNYLRLHSQRHIWGELRKRREALAGDIASLARDYLESEAAQTAAGRD